MSDIPRYLVSLNAITAWRDNAMIADQIGMVTYADHVDALRDCEERMLTTYLARDNFEAGLDAAREAVAALAAGRKRMDYEDGPQVYGAHNAYIDCVHDALHAIDALRKDSND
jgi:hypothetical protein